MVSLLCMSDRTHSQLMELLPEKCGAPQNKDFDLILAQVITLFGFDFGCFFSLASYLSVYLKGC